MFDLQQRFDFLHIRMSNACFLEFYEVIQHYFAEGPLVTAKLGVSVFQIDGFRFLELVLEEVSVRQIGLNHGCVSRREL